MMSNQSCELTVTGSAECLTAIRNNLSVTIAAIKNAIVDYMLNDVLSAIAAELEVASSGRFTGKEAADMAVVLFTHDQPGAQRVIQMLWRLLQSCDEQIRAILLGTVGEDVSKRLCVRGRFSTDWPEAVCVQFGGPLTAESLKTGHKLVLEEGMITRAKINLPLQLPFRLEG